MMYRNEVRIRNIKKYKEQREIEKRYLENQVERDGFSLWNSKGKLKRFDRNTELNIQFIQTA